MYAVGSVSCKQSLRIWQSLFANNPINTGCYKVGTPLAFKKRQEVKYEIGGECKCLDI